MVTLITLTSPQAARLAKLAIGPRAYSSARVLYNDLVVLGLADVTRAPGRNKHGRIYNITPAGRAWLAAKEKEQ